MWKMDKGSIIYKFHFRNKLKDFLVVLDRHAYTLSSRIT